METTKNSPHKKTLKSFLSKKDIIFDAATSVAVLCIMLIIISNPKRYTSGTIDGLKLFFFSVLPGLFPFMLLTKLLTEAGFLFKITKKLDGGAYFLFKTKGVSFYALFMSILSGYPIGAKIIADLFKKGLITSSEAKKMAAFCTTSGPIFIIGTVGTFMFGAFEIGLVLYLSHILSSIVLGICYGHFSKNDDCYYNIIKTNTISNKLTFGECVVETINSLFVVGAYITIFYLIAELLDGLSVFAIIEKLILPISNKLNFSKSNTKGLIYGFLEVTRGAKQLSFEKSILSICLCSGILSFSGISIIMQSMTFLKTAKIKMNDFVCFKIIHLILSIILCYFFCLFIIR